MPLKSLSLKSIRFDGGTQMRDCLSGDTVRDYAEAMKAGDKFPPLIVFHDGSDYWLGDGFHRWHAAAEAGLSKIECDIRQGSMRDAILFACSANGSHGLRRTNADKHKAVMTLLKDAEWERWSDRKIAEVCGVDHTTVGAKRNQLVESTSSTKGKDGKTRRRPKRKPPVVVTDAEPAPVAATADYTCPNCGGHESDEDEAGRFCIACKDPITSNDEEPLGVVERFASLWNAATPSERSTIATLVRNWTKHA